MFLRKGLGFRRLPLPTTGSVVSSDTFSPWVSFGNFVARPASAGACPAARQPPKKRQTRVGQATVRGQAGLALNDATACPRVMHAPKDPPRTLAIKNPTLL